MLVLSRHVGESFIIGDNIVVTVVRIAGGGVRIGIEAPSSYSVVRGELMVDAPGIATTRRAAPPTEPGQRVPPEHRPLS